MRQITRYILVQEAIALAFVAGALIGAIWLTQSLRFVDLIVNRGLPLSMFFYLSTLIIPTTLSLILPLAGFTAVLYAYNRLTLDSEMIVMRAAGLSPFALAIPALILSGLIMVSGYFNNLYFMPTAYRAFKDIEATVRNDYSAILIQEGVFSTLSDNITVYVRERSGDGTLQGILIHDEREPGKPVTMIAEKGTLITTDKGPRVILVNGNRQEVSKEKGQLSLLYFDNYTMDVRSVDRRLQQERWRKEDERYIGELLNPDMKNFDDAKNQKKFMAEAHNRLTAPLYSIAFCLIALTALLSSNVSRRGYGTRIGFAVLAVFILQSIALGLSNLGAKFPSAIFIMYLVPLLLIAGLAYHIFLRHPRNPAPLPAAPNGTAMSSL